jgi:hypothetical protein
MVKLSNTSYLAWAMPTNENGGNASEIKDFCRIHPCWKRASGKFWHNDCASSVSRLAQIHLGR